MDKKVSQLPIKITLTGGEYVHILDTLDLSDSPQGTDKRLNLLDWIVTRFQAILVSGTNIKTVNGVSLLGSGNINTELNIINILGNVTLNSTYNNSISLQKANSTITLPSGLSATFNFVIRRFAGTTTTFVAGAGATISTEGDGTSFAGKGMISVFCDGANNFIIAGQ